MATPQPEPRVRGVHTPRSFMVRPGGGDLFILNIIAGGQVVNRILLTEPELRACADECLKAIGWTPVDYRKETQK